MHAVLKPQDVVVLLKASMWPGGAWKFAELAKTVGMSPSEVHSATKRCAISQLVVLREDLGIWVVQRRNLEEFLLHGIRYVFPAERGQPTRGTPTALAAPVFERLLGPTSESATVWPHAEGTTRGPSLKPLYPSVPFAASIDSSLYDALAVVDALRGGRARERAVAAEILQQLMARR